MHLASASMLAIREELDKNYDKYTKEIVGDDGTTQKILDTEKVKELMSS